MLERGKNAEHLGQRPFTEPGPATRDLEIAGVVHKRRGSGTFVSDARPQLALRERRRVIEQRIDALLAEAHQLNFTTDDILRMVRERKAAMAPNAEPEEVEK